MHINLIHVVKLLVNLGVNVNAYRPGSRAGRPLHHAAKKGLLQTVELLLSHGANPLAMNDDCQTALDLARAKGYWNVVRLIESRICLFSGWLREAYGPSILEAFVKLSRRIWAVVLPCDYHSPVNRIKYEITIYPELQDAQPSYVIPLWKAQIEEPMLNQLDPALIILEGCLRKDSIPTPSLESEQQDSKYQKMVARRAVDLRSDTVTKPTEAMRAAMANADVDDDVLGSDPTAQRFEAEMAKVMGKEAALFVPSGTMGNLISVLVHCEIRGSEVILGDNSHIHIYENGGISTIGGVHPKTLRNNTDGTMDIDQIEAAIRHPGGELYYPTTRLICLENTHANCGGRCISVEYTDKVGELAKKHGLKLHIDGARIFNASVALGVPVHRLVQAADSVSVCMSKGLGAPVGSVIVGSRSFIAKAKRLRKTLGGGMRQVGVLCGAAYIALKDNQSKLEDDHRKAKILADGLNQIKQLSIDISSVETNMIFFNIAESSSISPVSLCQLLEEYGVLAMPVSSSSVRFVIHYQISENDVQYVLTCIKQAVQQPSIERASE